MTVLTRQGFAVCLPGWAAGVLSLRCVLYHCEVGSWSSNQEGSLFSLAGTLSVLFRPSLILQANSRLLIFGHLCHLLSGASDHADTYLDVDILSLVVRISPIIMQWQ